MNDCKYIPKSDEENFSIITLKTISCADDPNANGIIYSRRVLDEYVNDKNTIYRLKHGGMKITKGLWYPCNAMYFTGVNIADVLGDVIDIRYEEIDVKIPKDNSLDIKNLINSGYKPEMKYLANIDKNIVTKIDRIICFDMIKLPDRFRKDDK